MSPGAVGADGIVPSAPILSLISNSGAAMCLSRVTASQPTLVFMTDHIRAGFNYHNYNSGVLDRELQNQHDDRVWCEFPTSDFLASTNKPVLLVSMKLGGQGN